jgi:hypothetical protein
MAAEGQEIPEEIKADQVPAQEEGGDDEVGVTEFPMHLKGLFVLQFPPLSFIPASHTFISSRDSPLI